MPAQFGNFGVESVLAEKRGNPRSQALPRWFVLADGIAQDFARFLLHAAAVFPRALSQPLFHGILEIAHDELCHSDIMISQALGWPTQTSFAGVGIFIAGL